MTASVTVIGVPQLLARFVRAAALGQVAEVAAREVLARDVAAVARSRVPVATGALQASITESPAGVSTSVLYAPFVEYGTSDTPAQPFMRPAADTADGVGATTAAKAIMDRA